MRCSDKIDWSKNKGLTPSAQWLIYDQKVQLHLPEEVQSLGDRPSLTLTKPRRTRAQRCRTLRLIFPPARPHQGCTWTHAWTHTAATKRQRPNQPLLSFDYMSLGLGRGKLPFKLTHLFPGWLFVGFCWGFPLTTPFSGSLGFCVPYPIRPLFQARLCPFM